MTENQVFRFKKADFKEDECYEFALFTRKEGSWPGEKYYTTNPLEYLGKYKSTTETLGSGDISREAYNFDDNGKTRKIMLDYDGKTCFRKVPCRVSGGGRRRKKSRKTRTKQRKYKRTKKSRK